MVDKTDHMIIIRQRENVKVDTVVKQYDLLQDFDICPSLLRSQ